MHKEYIHFFHHKGPFIKQVLSKDNSLAWDENFVQQPRLLFQQV